MAANVLLMLRQSQPPALDNMNFNLHDIDKAENIIHKLALTEKTAKSCRLFLHQLRCALTQIGM
jgi:hypothetical protein